MPVQTFIVASSPLLKQYAFYRVEKASQLPFCCIELIAILNTQPLFDGSYEFYGSGRTFATGKAVRVVDATESRIFDILCRNLSPSNVIAFGFSSAFSLEYLADPLYDRHGPLIEAVFLFSHKLDPQFSIEKLKTKFKQIINQMGSNWISSNPDEHLEIAIRKPFPEFCLLIKKEETSLVEETALINAIANKVGFSIQEVLCSNAWEAPFASPPPYLWIKHSILEQAIQKLGLKIV